MRHFVLQKRQRVMLLKVSFTGRNYSDDDDDIIIVFVYFSGGDSGGYDGVWQF